MRNELLRLENILLYSDGIKVLDYLSMNLFKGEVLGIVGATGAGKSLLMKVLAGCFKPDDGQIIYNGRQVAFSNPLQAKKKGIAFIGQEINIIPNMSVAENILIGNKNLPKIYVDPQKEYMYAKLFADMVGLDVDLNKMAVDLTFVQCKLMEIARALSGNISILIMENPTLLLIEKEIGIFNIIIKKLKSKGISVIFTSHKLKEVIEVSDRIMVMRNGLLVGSYESSTCSEEQLIRAISGENKVLDKNTKRTLKNGNRQEELLRIKNLSTSELSNINFSLYKGEILGLAGLVGSGKSVLANTIYGVNRKYSGEIYIKGKKEIIKSPKDAIRLKIGMVQAENNTNALIENFRISQNISLSSMNRVTNHGILNPKLEEYYTKHYLEEVGLDPNLFDKRMEYISEGDKVKIEIAKLLAIRPAILILDEPTFGIDVVGKKEICALIHKLKGETGIILITSEMDDVIELFDRMLIMNSGAIVAELTGEECNPKNFIQYLI